MYLLELDRFTRHKKQMYKKFVNQAYLENEYEIVPRDPTLQETPVQKLRRLMFEVQELGEEIEKKKVNFTIMGSYIYRVHVMTYIINYLGRYSIISDPSKLSKCIIFSNNKPT